MNNRKLIIFFLVTLAVILAAGITSRINAPQKIIEKSYLFPDLNSRINDINRIAIIKRNQVTVELEQQEGTWVISNADNFPALFGNIKTMLINMANLKIVDRKTENPEFYRNLNVEDPHDEKSSSILITLYDIQNQVVASLIVGHSRQSAGSKPGLYVRKPDEKSALLVEGTLDAPNYVDAWFNTELFDIPSDRVKSVNIQYPDGKLYEIFKETPEQSDYQVRGDTSQEESVASASRIIINRIANGMQEMRANGVMAEQNFVYPDDVITTTVTTFDGLVIHSRLVKTEDKSFANFSFTASEKPEASDENNKTEHTVDVGELALSLNHALSGWVFQIPDFKYEALTTNPESLRKTIQNLEE